jgi:hypothetical protein
MYGWMDLLLRESVNMYSRMDGWMDLLLREIQPENDDCLSRKVVNIYLIGVNC